MGNILKKFVLIVFFLVIGTDALNDLKRNNNATKVASDARFIADSILYKIDYLCQSACNVTISKLSYLLNLLCNNTQLSTTNITACMSCFKGATSDPTTTTIITSLASCAATYLPNTNYSQCNTLIQNALQNSQFDVWTGCPTGYCRFVRCVRRVNADNLINYCYNNSLTGNNVNTSIGQIGHYKNVTSCILARARCSTYNPISGLPQNNRAIATVLGTYTTTTMRFYNSLQITASGDLRVLSLSAATSIRTRFCSTTTSLSQSVWRNITCT